ncbi:ShlB/FhaC/HecB family hemolysin secretion/activation protein [Fodinicurvata sediminis]|uniref:ShlB/FhaC/HecB family hemolysin secretion/activation protein n=1 Tax=Fodinicurvata sediminis TaxID=1121832 RepID=UPI0003B6D142|nr:ShlB/FhaC/HecB family hemolysin secretion/activation protein [Fodinicurvata sediminis]
MTSQIPSFLPVRAVLAVALLLVFLSAETAWGQSREIENLVVDQNRVIERFRQPLEVQPSLDLAVPLERRALVDLPEKPYLLRRIAFSGTKVIPYPELGPLWQDLKGQAVGRGQIEDLVVAVERYYYERDYFARALVTEWDVEAGVLHIQVFDAYIEEIRINSDIPDVASRLQPYLDRIAGQVPLRVSRLERNLLLIEDLEGFSIDALLEKIPDNVQAGRLTLQVDPEGPGGRVVFDNTGSDDIGPYQAIGHVEVGDIFQLFESNALTVVTNPFKPREFFMGQWQQSAPLGTEGLRFGYSLGYVESRPGGEAAELDIEAKTTLSSFWLEYPFLRRIDYNLLGRLDISTQDDRIWAGSTRIITDRQRWATLSASYDQNFESSAFLGRVSLSQGLESLGSSDVDAFDVARYGGRPDFSLMAVEGHWHQNLDEDWSLAASATGQLAFTRLPQTMRLTLGDNSFARAYSRTSVVGDSGFAGALTLRYSLDSLLDEVKGLSSFAFVDQGYLHNDPLGTEFRAAHLGSVGLGLAFRDLASITLAQPTWSSREIEDRGTQVFFQLQYAF